MPSALNAGNTVVAPLTFSDPADYSPTSLSTTLTIGNGISANTVRFSEIDFMNVATTVNPDAVPCNANGLRQDHDPARFTGTYSVSQQVAPVPEPATGVLVLAFGMVLVAGRKFIRAA